MLWGQDSIIIRNEDLAMNSFEKRACEVAEAKDQVKRTELLSSLFEIHEKFLWV